MNKKSLRMLIILAVFGIILISGKLLAKTNNTELNPVLISITQKYKGVKTHNPTYYLNLHWKNPTYSQVKDVVICKKETYPPANASDCDQKIKLPKNKINQQYQDYNVKHGYFYYYQVFSYDKNSNYLGESKAKKSIVIPFPYSD